MAKEVSTLLVGYILILLIVIAYLVRRSYQNYNGYIARWLRNREDAPHQKHLMKRVEGVKVRQPPQMPYSYEVVKAQLPFADENHFYTEISRSHLHHQAPKRWSPPPIQERRNLPQLYVECLLDHRKSATDELKENSTNEFKKEKVYKTYSDIENNELTCFNSSLSINSDSCMSLIEENDEFSIRTTSPSSSRNNSEKRKSPFDKIHSPFERKMRKPSESSSIKNKFKKKKLTSTISNEGF